MRDDLGLGSTFSICKMMFYIMFACKISGSCSYSWLAVISPLLFEFLGAVFYDFAKRMRN
jgi:hypothetical protein